MLSHIDPRFTLAGLIVGACVGFSGVGGGSLMTPLLIVLFGMNPLVAVGTDLLYSVPTKIVGVEFSRREVADVLLGAFAEREAAS